MIKEVFTYGSGGVGGGDTFLVLGFDAPTGGGAEPPEDGENLAEFVN